MTEDKNGRLKRGLRIKVLDNPRDPTSKVLGIGTLKNCQDKKVYYDFPAELWWVTFEDGENRKHIVCDRDLLPE